MNKNLPFSNSFITFMYIFCLAMEVCPTKLLKRDIRNSSAECKTPFEV